MTKRTPGARKRRTWPAVEVVWHDAHGGDVGWVELEGRHGKPATIRTVGMLARESHDGYVVVLSHDQGADMFGGYVFIPKSNVVSIKGVTDETV